MQLFKLHDRIRKIVVPYRKVGNLYQRNLIWEFQILRWVEVLRNKFQWSWTITVSVFSDFNNQFWPCAKVPIS
jgi:hypothetical protein